MKILQINSVCGIRSTGRICTDILDVLKSSGHECKIAYGRENVPQKYQQYALRIGNNIGVKIHALQSRLWDNAGFGSKTATKKFVKWAESFNPDIIHLHNIHGYYINIEILFDYLRKAGKPVIWTLHDCWAFTGHCAYFDYINCQKWKTGTCESCPQKGAYPSSLLFDNSKQNFAIKKELFNSINMTIVTPSLWLANLVKESFLGKHKVCVIPNGIDLDAFKPTYGNFREKYSLLNKKIILGVASVWEKRKGFKDFIELSKLLDDTYRIVLVGVSEKQANELPGNIIGIPRTNSTRELAEIYTAADVFVNLTYEDNYPTTNLEAQACGTPVLTYNTGGSTESVPGDCVVAQGDLAALYEKIINNSAKIKEDLAFDKKVMMDKYLDIYSEQTYGKEGKMLK